MKEIRERRQQEDSSGIGWGSRQTQKIFQNLQLMDAEPRIPQSPSYVSTKTFLRFIFREMSFSGFEFSRTFGGTIRTKVRKSDQLTLEKGRRTFDSPSFFICPVPGKILIRKSRKSRKPRKPRKPRGRKTPAAGVFQRLIPDTLSARVPFFSGPYAV